MAWTSNCEPEEHEGYYWGRFPDGTEHVGYWNAAEEGWVFPGYPLPFTAEEMADKGWKRWSTPIEAPLAAHKLNS